MEPSVIEKESYTAVTLAAICKDESLMLRKFTQLKEDMERVKKQNTILLKENYAYINIDRECSLLKREICDLRDQLEIKEKLCKSWKKKEEHIFEVREQLKQVTKDRDSVTYELSFCKRNLSLQQKKIKEMDATLSRNNKEHTEKMHVLQLEVENFQKVYSNVLTKLLPLKNLRGELAKRDKIIVKETRRCSDLEEQVTRVIKELESLPPPLISIQLPLNKPPDVIKVYRENQELKEKLVSKIQELTTKDRLLEKKDHLIREIEKQCEVLKALIPPPERLASIQKCHDEIRELKIENRELKKEKISLMAQNHIFQTEAMTHKSQYENLCDREAAIKKWYLNEKMQNRDLREALKKSGAGQEEKPPVFPITKKRPCRFVGKSSYAVLPPITRKPYQQRSADPKTKVFITETDQN